MQVEALQHWGCSVLLNVTAGDDETASVLRHTVGENEVIASDCEYWWADTAVAVSDDEGHRAASVPRSGRARVCTCVMVHMRMRMPSCMRILRAHRSCTASVQRKCMRRRMHMHVGG